MSVSYRIGICSQLDHAPLLAQAGADHIEPAFGVVAAMESEAYARGVDALKRSGLCVDSMNSMLPGTTALYGTMDQTDELMDFVRRGMDRAAELGCRNVIFGSGTARRIPPGHRLRVAQLRIATLLDRFCNIARPYGIRIAIEPLRAQETNFIHTLDDAAQIIALLPHCNNLGITADIYHMLEGNENFSALGAVGDKLFHVHVCAPDRHFPRPQRPVEDGDIYRSFFCALNAAGYDGTVSIEAIAQNLSEECAPALHIIREAARAAAAR